MVDGENDGGLGANSGMTEDPVTVADSTYIVQRCVGVEGELASGATWVDIATVTVPPRTKRRGVLVQALEDAGVEIGKTGQQFRVLDVACSEAIEVREESTTTVVIG